MTLCKHDGQQSWPSNTSTLYYDASPCLLCWKSQYNDTIHCDVGQCAITHRVTVHHLLHRITNQSLLRQNASDKHVKLVQSKEKLLCHLGKNGCFYEICYARVKWFVNNKKTPILCITLLCCHISVNIGRYIQFHAKTPISYMYKC